MINDFVAQLAEQYTFNVWVARSSRAEVTSISISLMTDFPALATLLKVDLLVVVLRPFALARRFVLACFSDLRILVPLREGRMN